MATNAQILLGSTFSFNSVTIGEVISVNGTLFSRQATSVLTCDSTNGVAEKLKAGGEYGELTIGCVYDPSAGGDYNSLATAAPAGTEGTATFTYPDNTTVSATAFISNLGIPSAGDPNAIADVTLTVTPVSAWTYTDKPS